MERSGDRWLLELLTSTPTIDQQEDVLTIIGDHGQLILTRQDLAASDEDDRGVPDDADNPESGPGVFPIIDVEVELYHCGFMPIDAAQTRWVPTDTPFDATNAPDSWVGRGRLLQGPDETLYADLSGIEVPMQELLGEFDPLLCQ